MEISDSKIIRQIKQKQTEQMFEIRRILDISDLLKQKYHGLLYHNDYLNKICLLVAECIDINQVLMY